MNRKIMILFVLSIVLAGIVLYIVNCNREKKESIIKETEKNIEQTMMTETDSEIKFSLRNETESEIIIETETEGTIDIRTLEDRQIQDNEGTKPYKEPIVKENGGSIEIIIPEDQSTGHL